MNHMKDLIQENIDNLSLLWKTVSIPFESFYSNPIFEYCEIVGSDWPNRLWYTRPLDAKTIIKTKELLSSTSRTITIPYWDIDGLDTSRFLDENGFKVAFEQIGMSLKLANKFEIQNRLIIKRISTEFESVLWADLFSKSFGYNISSETIIKSLNEVCYYLAYSNGHAVGTAIMHKTNDISGVHAVGIPPEWRRKGFADQIMKLLINQAILNGSNYMTLQASNMGLGLYLKLGFKEQFRIKNYKLKDE